MANKIDPNTGRELSAEEWQEYFRRSLEAAPPMEERDGTRARHTAADRDKWQWRHSDDGHLCWVPPEIAYLVNNGEPLHELELRPALAESRIKDELASPSPVSDTTETRCFDHAELLRPARHIFPEENTAVDAFGGHVRNCRRRF
jgi:hypothetical protein